MKVRAIVLSLVLLAFTAPLARADGPISLAQYRQAIDEALALVDQALRAAPAQRPDLLLQAARRLGDAQEVQLESGGLIRLNNAAAITEIEQAARAPESADGVRKAEGRVRALQAFLADLPAAATASERATLHDILNQPPFKPSELADWFSRLLQQFADWLNGWSAPSTNFSIRPEDIVVALAILVTLAVFAFILISLRRNFAGEAQLKSANPNGEGLTAPVALKEARELARSGNYRSAIRQLYLASLLLLEERGRLRADRSLTNREYLAALKGEPQVAHTLEPIVETFDRIWYGFEPISGPEFERYQQQVETLKDL